MNHYTLNNFYHENINICVCICTYSRRGIKFEKRFVSQFVDLNELIDTCIASSHIPYISNGDIFYMYNNSGVINKCVDGGVFRNVYPDDINPCIIIDPMMWNTRKLRRINKFSSLKTLNMPKLFMNGYNDAYKNRNFLDDIFHR